LAYCYRGIPARWKLQLVTRCFSARQSCAYRDASFSWSSVWWSNLRVIAF